MSYFVYRKKSRMSRRVISIFMHDKTLAARINQRLPQSDLGIILIQATWSVWMLS